MHICSLSLKTGMFPEQLKIEIGNWGFWDSKYSH